MTKRRKPACGQGKSLPGLWMVGGLETVAAQPPRPTASRVRHACPMRFTEHELTAALTGAAKTVVAANRKVRKGGKDIDTVWNEMDRYERFKVLDALGSQILPVLVGLPDVEVEPGTRP